jgi:SAM-dependent MidA family methyltransferase
MADPHFYQTRPDLPMPNAAALMHSQRLCRLIADEIAAAQGSISFARYMELALYAPGLGYYSAGSRKFGAQGDYITAPELSSLFAQCLARQIASVLAENGGSILEFGAGSGILCAGILRQLQAMNCLPAEYCILDISPDLRERQRLTLQSLDAGLCARVRWLDRLPAPGFRGVMLANEVLDAMPVYRFVRSGQHFDEQRVAWNGGQFIWASQPVDNADLASRLAALGELPDAYASEIGLAAPAWIATLGGILEQGLILLIDYGFPQQEYYHPQRSQGTLMCHYRHHAHDDPLRWTGLQDITAHVDFTALARAGEAGGLRVAGFTSQAQFLLAAGLLEFAATPAASPEDHWRLANEIKRLTLPSEMGELFKVMALTRRFDAPLIGFQAKDQRYRL